MLRQISMFLKITQSFVPIKNFLWTTSPVWIFHWLLKKKPMLMPIMTAILNLGKTNHISQIQLSKKVQTLRRFTNSVLNLQTKSFVQIVVRKKKKMATKLALALIVMTISAKNVSALIVKLVMTIACVNV